MIWYKAGVQTAQCHKVALADGREILVCMSRYGGWQGWASTSLYLEDLLKPAVNLSAEAGNERFLEPFDDTGTCGLNDEDYARPNPLTLRYIERVTFGVRRGDAIVLSVIAQYGTRPMTLADVKQCEQGRNSSPSGSTSFKPQTKRRVVDFLFDGHGYHVAPWSPKIEEVAAGH